MANYLNLSDDMRRKVLSAYIKNLSTLDRKQAHELMPYLTTSHELGIIPEFNILVLGVYHRDEYLEPCCRESIFLIRDVIESMAPESTRHEVTVNHYEGNIVVAYTDESNRFCPCCGKPIGKSNESKLHK